MEVVEKNEFNILQGVIDDEDIKRIPKDLLKKIYSHFNTKCEEFITAKAVFETNRKLLGKC